MAIKETILEGLVQNAKGEILKAKANVEVYLDNPAGIGEHPDVLAAIQTELDKICTNEERIDIINKHFKV
jgi:hypothetical protein|tara:strand:- start:206 stop:415 length:210 start_codon:yes stop_codon:yes gene_type:complete